MTFSLVSNNVLSAGSAGTWDQQGIYQLTVVEVVGGVWHAIYTGNNYTYGSIGLGYATSPDGQTWTKYASNPVFPDGSAAFVTKIGSIYYCWFNYVSPDQSDGGLLDTPSDIYRIQSTDLKNWTNLIPSLPRTLAFEGPGAGTPGQTGNPWLVEVSGTTYMFYMGTTNSALSGSSSIFEYTVASTPLTLAQLVATNEGVLGLQTRSVNVGANIGAASTTLASNTGNGSTFKCIAGNDLVVFIRTNSASITVTALHDTAGNSFTLVSTDTETSDIGYWYLCKNCLGNSANVVTATLSGAGSDYNGLVVWQISGDPSNAIAFDVDATAVSAIAGTTLTSATFSTAYNSELVLAAPLPGAAPNTTSPGTITNIFDGTDKTATPYINAIHGVLNSPQTGIAATATDGSHAWEFFVAAFGINIKQPSGANWYPVDCRDYSSFPLTPVIVQGSGIYALDPNSDNSKLPPTDSRK